MRTAVIAILAAGLIGLFAWRLAESFGEQNDGKGPAGRGGRAVVPVETALPRRAEIRDVRVFTGTLKPRARYYFAPKIGGRLESLAVNIGDPVKAGQLIARLDDEEHVQQVNQARAALDVAEAAVEQQATQLELARREMERTRALWERKVTSEAEWDKAEAKYKAQAAQLKLAEAQMAEKRSALKAAEIRLGYTRIYAPEEPAGGAWRVEDRYVDAGAMLAANAPLVSVVDLKSLTAVIHVIERDYPAIAEGLSVEVGTDAFPGKTFEGKVIRIAPVLREASRQARIEIEVPNEALRLRPGMFIRARMEFDRHKNALLVPRTALVKRDGAEGVFVVTDGDAPAARFVSVTPGIRSADSVEILQPNLTDPVVTLGQHLLADGSLVLPVEANAAEGDADASATARGDAP